jgi:hypothetical protein
MGTGDVACAVEAEDVLVVRTGGWGTGVSGEVERARRRDQVGWLS